MGAEEQIASDPREALAAYRDAVPRREDQADRRRRPLAQRREAGPDRGPRARLRRPSGKAEKGRSQARIARQIAETRSRPRASLAYEPMFDSKQTLTERLADAVDLLIDFATLGEYGLEPVGRPAPACQSRRRPHPPRRGQRRAADRGFATRSLRWTSGPGWRRHIRAIVAAGLALLASLAVGGAGQPGTSASVVLVPDHSPWSEQVEIEAVSPGRIESSSDPKPLSARASTGSSGRPGTRCVGPILEREPEPVTRRLSRCPAAISPPGSRPASTATSTPATRRKPCGLPYRTVGRPRRARADASLGDPSIQPGQAVPAAPGRSSSTASTDDRQIGLRIAPTLRRAGFNSLLISYRDDLGAPDSPDGLHHQGQTEWRDLEAAVQLRDSPRRPRNWSSIGYSMGGALIAQFMEHSPLAEPDRRPGPRRPGPRLEGRSSNSTRHEWDSRHSSPCRWSGRSTPASTSTGTASTPSSTPRTSTCRSSSSTVTRTTWSRSRPAKSSPTSCLTGSPTTAVPKAGHTQSWNVDPALYDRRLRRFLLQIDETSTKPKQP